jgi:hypothetical protein
MGLHCSVFLFLGQGTIITDPWNLDQMHLTRSHQLDNIVRIPRM